MAVTVVPGKGLVEERTKSRIVPGGFNGFRGRNPNAEERMFTKSQLARMPKELREKARRLNARRQELNKSRAAVEKLKKAVIKKSEREGNTQALQILGGTQEE